MDDSGSGSVRLVDRRTLPAEGILDGTLDDRVLSFHTSEQAIVGSETADFRDLYRGMVEDRRIRFTLSSDRPWGFPVQSFLATRE